MQIEPTLLTPSFVLFDENLHSESANELIKPGITIKFTSLFSDTLKVTIVKYRKKKTKADRRHQKRNKLRLYKEVKKYNKLNYYASNRKLQPW